MIWICKIEFTFMGGTLSKAILAEAQDLKEALVLFSEFIAKHYVSGYHLYVEPFVTGGFLWEN